jgi:hypothetical protein
MFIDERRNKNKTIEELTEIALDQCVLLNIQPANVCKGLIALNAVSFCIAFRINFDIVLSIIKNKNFEKKLYLNTIQKYFILASKAPRCPHI